MISYFFCESECSIDGNLVSFLICSSPVLQTFQLGMTPYDTDALWQLSWNWQKRTTMSWSKQLSTTLFLFPGSFSIHTLEIMSPTLPSKHFTKRQWGQDYISSTTAHSSCGDARNFCGTESQWTKRGCK